MPRRVYYTIFASLIVLTAATVLVARLDLGPLNTIVALGIASLKACLVLLYFMHLRYTGKFIWVCLAMALVWLALLLLVTLSDYATRAWIGVPGF
jgi:cytochrome c oxidase subunit 4